MFEVMYTIRLLASGFPAMVCSLMSAMVIFWDNAVAGRPFDHLVNERPLFAFSDGKLPAHAFWWFAAANGTHKTPSLLWNQRQQNQVLLEVLKNEEKRCHLVKKRICCRKMCLAHFTESGDFNLTVENIQNVVVNGQWSITMQMQWICM